MNQEQIYILAMRETDVEGALKRLNGREDIYIACLKDFVKDETVENLNEYISKGMWDDAFTAAHAIKGMAGNMGFIPLMHAVGELVVLIRGGRMNVVNVSLEKVNSAYRDIIDGIHNFFIIADGKKERMILYENRKTR